MNKIIVPFIIIVFAACGSSKKSPLTVKKELPDELKEISGITVANSYIWAISDKPKAVFYKLDTLGNVLQQVHIKDETVADVEAITSDDSYLYIGDVGDNTGDRTERKIIRVLTSSIKGNDKAKAEGQAITFTFPGEVATEHKKQNNYDCESLLSYKDSLYVFTKDREDKETRLYVLPKTPGTYEARYIDSFNSKGLVTDAAINASNNELALIGYRKGHTSPFIILFNNFRGNDFFSGKHKRLELTDKRWDWQLEGITYNRDDMVYFSCEKTNEVKATFYGVKRSDLMKLDKKNSGKNKKGEKYSAHMSTKGHLKF